MKKLIILLLFVLIGKVAIAQNSEKPIYFSIQYWAAGEYSELSKKYIYDTEKEISGYITVKTVNKNMVFDLYLNGKSTQLTIKEFLADNYNNGKHQMMFKAYDSGYNTVTIKVVDQNDGTFCIYTFYDNTSVVFYCTPVK